MIVVSVVSVVSPGISQVAASHRQAPRHRPEAKRPGLSSACGNHPRLHVSTSWLSVWGALQHPRCYNKLLRVQASAASAAATTSSGQSLSKLQNFSSQGPPFFTTFLWENQAQQWVFGALLLDHEHASSAKIESVETLTLVLCFFWTLLRKEKEKKVDIWKRVFLPSGNLTWLLEIAIYSLP